MKKANLNFDVTWEGNERHRLWLFENPWTLWNPMGILWHASWSISRQRTSNIIPLSFLFPLCEWRTYSLAPDLIQILITFETFFIDCRNFYLWRKRGTATSVNIRGGSAALGRRMPWANRLFSKSVKGKILNFLHEVEKIISVISVQD